MSLLEEVPQWQNLQDLRSTNRPATLCPMTVFDELVEDYKFATIKRYGQGYVAYIVLADLG